MKKYILMPIVFALIMGNVKAQSWQWVKRGASSSVDHVQNLCIDANGNSYIIGQFGFHAQPANYMIFDNDTVFNNGVDQIFLVKYSPSGNVIWAKSIGGNNPNNGAASYNEFGVLVVYDYVTNSIIISGDFAGTCNFGSTSLFGIQDLFLAKLDLNGNFLWAKGIYCNSVYDNYSSALTTDAFGNIYLGGGNKDSAQFDQFNIPAGNFLTKYDVAGNCLWAKRKFVDSGARKIKIYNNSLYILGGISNDTAQIDTTTFISNLSSNMFFSKFDTSGTLTWIKYPTSRMSLGGNDLDMDLNGNFYIAGGFQNNINFDGNTLFNANTVDMYLIKYDSNGNVIWLKQANASNSAVGSKLASTSDGSIYVGGTFTGNASFGTFSVSSVANNDHYITRFTPNGDCLGVRQYSGGAYFLILRPITLTTVLLQVLLLLPLLLVLQHYLLLVFQMYLLPNTM